MKRKILSLALCCVIWLSCVGFASAGGTWSGTVTMEIPGGNTSQYGQDSDVKMKDTTDKLAKFYTMVE